MNENSLDKIEFPYPIASRYHCEKYLGSGGSGAVYKAWDDLLQRFVAIKFIKMPSFISRQRLVNEARALAKLKHPSLCSVYDVGEPADTNSSLFLVMELAEGRPLTELAENISVTDAVLIVQTLTEGVAELHAAGLVHNDINPTNVIVERHPNQQLVPVLIDLSVAEPFSDTNVRQRGPDTPPLFSAPEQSHSRPVNSAKELVDIYSLGALLFFLLTGQAPSEQAGRRLKSSAVKCPRSLRKIILTCLAQDPADRYQSAETLAQQLTGFLYQKNHWLPLSVAVASALLLTGMITAIVSTSPVSTYLQGSGLQQPKLLVHRGMALANHVEHLMRVDNAGDARTLAQLAINLFNHALEENEADINALLQLVDFLEQQERGPFTKSELTALLLDSASRLEQLNPNDDNHLLWFNQARLYQALAEQYERQPHLASRWYKAALHAAEQALYLQPDSAQYQQFYCQLQNFTDQSNSGTC
ncbi:serine/threonine protein kinase [Idiomarina seosinensis]|uniref:protein kinase domain-containing protein n=1 Tax=Idiomarina seosinensis TaxID=281739 RepID=UPI00384B678B